MTQLSDSCGSELIVQHMRIEIYQQHCCLAYILCLCCLRNNNNMRRRRQHIPFTHMKKIFLDGIWGGNQEEYVVEGNELCHKILPWVLPGKLFWSDRVETKPGTRWPQSLWKCQTQEFSQHSSKFVTVLSYQNESFFIKMRAAFLASILPRVMKEGLSKEGSSHFDEKLSFWWKTLILIGHYSTK